MGVMDQRADNWFGICEDYVNGAHGTEIVFRRSQAGDSVDCVLATRKDAGEMRCYTVSESTWDEIEEDDIHVRVTMDGVVSIRYSKEENGDCGMRFRVAHPREVSELFHLLISPAEYLRPTDEDVGWEQYRLGDMATFHVALPDNGQWKIVDPLALPNDAPEDFRKALHLNLTRNWAHFLSGETCSAWEFSERWPDFIQSLPDATAQLLGAYVLDPENKMLSAVDYAVIPPMGPPTGSVYLNMLITPNSFAVSSLYLREQMSMDKQLARAVESAFSSGDQLQDMMSAIQSVAMRAPDLHHQIRIAAEQSAVREWVLGVSNRLAYQPGCSQRTNNAHLAHVLSRMLIK